MQKKATMFRTALSFTVLAFANQWAVANDGNLLKDPSFELELPAKEGGWIPFDESMLSSDKARSGNRSMFNWGYSRSVPYPPYFVGTVSGSYQEFPATAGSRWRLTGYGKASAKLQGGLAFGIVQVSFFDAGGKDLGTIETTGDETTRAKISNKLTSQSPDDWVFLDTGIATAPEGTVTVQAFTLYVDFSGSDTTQGVYFDDLNLCAVADDDDDGSGCIDQGS